MYVLGLTTMGDAAETLLRDGKIVAAAEEERFRSSITAASVSQITTSYAGMLRHPSLLRQHCGPSEFRYHFLEHHLCHAASAFYPSPFESAAILTLDGTGEATTTMFSVGRGTELLPIRRIKLPNSLGQFYSAVTSYLGFDMFAGDEWKIMGLAAYGKPRFREFFADEVLRIDGPGSFRLNVRVLDHHLAKNYRFSERPLQQLGPARAAEDEITDRHQDVAATAQAQLEEVVLHLLSWAHERTGERNLCLAGGVAFNSVMNGRIIDESPFDQVWVQPVAGDAGCSLGAAGFRSARESFAVDRWTPTVEACLRRAATAGRR